MLLMTVATMALPGSADLAAELIGADEHHGVAVHAVAVMIDEEGAIAVAVERHAEARAGGDHRRLQRLHRRRAAAGVDVPAVGRDADGPDVEAEGREQRRGDGGRGAVRAVHDDRRAGERPGVIENLAQVRHVVRGQFGIGARHGGTVGHLPGVVGDDRLDPPLLRFRELLAGAREHLDAVVVEGIVRCGDHDAEIEPPRCASGTPRPAWARHRGSRR
jgi:hypothetical protein